MTQPTPQHPIKQWLKKQPAIAASLFCVVLFSWAQTTGSPLTDRLDHLIYDMRLKAMLPYKKLPPAEHRILIADIDEKSLQTIGRWPWSRSVIKEMVANLQNAGVVVIGFDVVFSEPELNPAMVVLEGIPDDTMHASLESLAKQFDYDRILADQLGEGDVIGGLFFFKNDTHETGLLPDPVIALDEETIRNTVVGDMDGYTSNLDVLQESFYNSGFVTVQPDIDGSIRRVPLFLKYRDQLYASLALEITRTYLLLEELNVSTKPLDEITSIVSVELGKHNVNTAIDSSVLIPYNGGKGYYQYVSAVDIINNTFEPDIFKGAIVLVGTSAIGLSDLKATPLSPAYPGVESHATVIDSLLRGTIPQRPDWVIGLTLVISLVIGIFLTYLLPRLGPALSVVVSLFFVVGAVAGNFYLWQAENFDLPLASMLALIVTIFAINTAYGFYLEGKDKRFLNDAFKSYISPELIDQMIDAGANPELGGSEGILSAYFTDIQGFSSFSEELGSPTRLVELLNEYLTEMTELLLDNGGTLDKYEGDAIIAFYGAPMPLENHAQSACVSALKMQEKLGDLREKWQSEGDKWPDIVKNMRMRIGVNSGPIVTGNMGSSTRMNYTMMGDTVNLAARLEEGAKQYGVFTLVSESTLEMTDGHILSRQIDKVKVMGKSIPVSTYELLHLNKEEAPDNLVKLCTLFDEGKELYEAMRWDDAIAKFEECLPLEVHHPEREKGCKTCPAMVFIDRAEAYKENPPVPAGEEWDGVYTATEK